MAWTPPRSWAAGELDNAALMNQQLRDNLLVLKANVGGGIGTVDGVLNLGVKTFGYGSGQSNVGGGGDYHLTSYDVPIPAGYLSVVGAGVVIRAFFTMSATAGTKVVKLQLGAGTLVTLISATNVSTNYYVHLVLRGRGASTGSVTGTWLGATAPGNMADLTIGTLTNHGLSSLSNGSAQTLAWWCNAAANGEVLMSELSVMGSRSISGALV